ncbi:endonuclease domain-containing 1 protein-like [Sinocyclocheilus anshuiensis]|uniref:endonuclease domain-containing 1 protein-like n=1 Tax=Sinocyclocheilus anshuiensis TaxID=1608454 RepID=UPI0007B8E703|nr:PREDICTED: endonuclease domain-containing 1 protein-like [Sinocyclocheilus anshuiensis]
MRLFITVLLALSCPFGRSEVLQTFNKCSEFFSEGQVPVIPGILNLNSEHARYKKICQRYSFTSVGSGYTFATLYDTESRIPVFSAYKYTARGDFIRPKIPWMIEPQPDPHVVGMTVPYRNQAIHEDYFENRYGVNRGHLFPNCHAADEFTAKSTFTLTNIVPQNIRFNAGGWNRIENETRDTMSTHCYDNNNKVLAHVLTGAIPGKNKLNNRVNIPSYMWTAFCCYNSRERLWVSQAYWALNKQEKNNAAISKKSLQELQQFLSQNLAKNVQLFKNCN